MSRFLRNVAGRGAGLFSGASVRPSPVPSMLLPGPGFAGKPVPPRTPATPLPAREPVAGPDPAGTPTGERNHVEAVAADDTVVEPDSFGPEQGRAPEAKPVAEMGVPTAEPSTIAEKSPPPEPVVGGTEPASHLPVERASWRAGDQQAEVESVPSELQPAMPPVRRDRAVINSRRGGDSLSAQRDDSRTVTGDDPGPATQVPAEMPSSLSDPKEPRVPREEEAARAPTPRIAKAPSVRSGAPEGLEPEPVVAARVEPHESGAPARLARQEISATARAARSVERTPEIVDELTRPPRIAATHLDERLVPALRPQISPQSAPEELPAPVIDAPVIPVRHPRAPKPSSVPVAGMKAPEPRPVEVRIGTIEVSSAAPPSPVQTPPPAPTLKGFDDHLYVRSYLDIGRI